MTCTCWEDPHHKALLLNHLIPSAAGKLLLKIIVLRAGNQVLPFRPNCFVLASAPFSPMPVLWVQPPSASVSLRQPPSASISLHHQPTHILCLSAYLLGDGEMIIANLTKNNNNNINNNNNREYPPPSKARAIFRWCLLPGFSWFITMPSPFLKCGWNKCIEVTTWEWTMGSSRGKHKLWVKFTA